MHFTNQELKVKKGTKTNTLEVSGQETKKGFHKEALYNILFAKITFLILIQ